MISARTFIREPPPNFTPFISKSKSAFSSRYFSFESASAFFDSSKSSSAGTVFESVTLPDSSFERTIPRSAAWRGPMKIGTPHSFSAPEKSAVHIPETRTISHGFASISFFSASGVINAAIFPDTPMTVSKPFDDSRTIG